MEAILQMEQRTDHCCNKTMVPRVHARLLIEARGTTDIFLCPVLLESDLHGEAIVDEVAVGDVPADVDACVSVQISV